MGNTPAIQEKKQIQVINANLANPSGMLELAGTVKQFIIEQKLTTAIQGRNYVNVEGWQFAGGMIGVLPISKGTQDLSSGDEIKYKASVELLNIHTQQIVGAGFATCSNKEQGKKFFAEYAIESMAQTRAVGKAYRLMLGWLMKAAGYESTPAEEMDFQQAEVVQEAPKPAKQTPAQPVEKAQPVAEAAALEEKQPEPKFATARQKEEIIRLLNKPLINRQEKTKGLLNINKLTEEQATRFVTKLKNMIEAREQEEFNQDPPFPTTADAPTQLEPTSEKQRQHIEKLIQSHHFSAAEKEEAVLKCESAHFTVAEAADYIDQLHQAIKGREAREKAKGKAVAA